MPLAALQEAEEKGYFGQVDTLVVKYGKMTEGCQLWVGSTLHFFVFGWHVCRERCIFLEAGCLPCASQVFRWVAWPRCEEVHVLGGRGWHDAQGCVPRRRFHHVNIKTNPLNFGFEIVDILRAPMEYMSLAYRVFYDHHMTELSWKFRYCTATMSFTAAQTSICDSGWLSKTLRAGQTWSQVKHSRMRLRPQLSPTRNSTRVAPWLSWSRVQIWRFRTHQNHIPHWPGLSTSPWFGSVWSNTQALFEATVPASDTVP